MRNKKARDGESEESKRLTIADHRPILMAQGFLSIGRKDRLQACPTTGGPVVYWCPSRYIQRIWPAHSLQQDWRLP